MITDHTSHPRHGQGHVLQWWGQLDEAERLQLVSELEEVDLAEMEHMWRTTCGEDSTAARDRDMSSMAPVGGCIELTI